MLVYSFVEDSPLFDRGGAVVEVRVLLRSSISSISAG
jgi:hypothetical protein